MEAAVRTDSGRERPGLAGAVAAKKAGSHRWEPPASQVVPSLLWARKSSSLAGGSEEGFSAALLAMSLL